MLHLKIYCLTHLKGSLALWSQVFCEYLEKSVICCCFVENVSNTLGNMLMCKLMNYRKDYLSSYNFFCFSQFIKKLSSAEIFYEKWYSLESCWNYGPSLLWPWLYKWGWGEGGRHRYLLLSLLLWILIRSFATEWQDGGQKEAESGVVW